ncbi:MAG: YicC family protein, partial [Aestuariivirgaceae bacterium]
ALDRLLKLAKAVQKKHKLPPPSVEGLLALRGVLEEIEEPVGDDMVLARNRLLLNTLAQAFDHLLTTRRQEGEKLRAVLLAQIDCLAALAEEARDNPERSPERIKARLQLQLDRLLDSGRNFDPDRLHQEALLLATRSDIQEELDRIFAHVSAARQLLKDGAGPVGRKLDFLAQEFHREANTLCAKSQAQALSAIGLALKGVIDQMREQVQNIE